MQQHHQRPRGRRQAAGIAGPYGLDDVKTDAVGVHIQVAPWPVDAGYRRIRWRHLPTRGIAGGVVAALRVPAVALGELLGLEFRAGGLVMARRERGARLLDRFDRLARPANPAHLRKPSRASAAPTTTMIPKTIRYATQRHSQVSSSSAMKKKKRRWSKTAPRVRR